MQPGGWVLNPVRTSDCRPGPRCDRVAKEPAGPWSQGATAGISAVLARCCLTCSAVEAAGSDVPTDWRGGNSPGSSTGGRADGLCARVHPPGLDERAAGGPGKSPENDRASSENKTRVSRENHRGAGGSRRGSVPSGLSFSLLPSRLCPRPGGEPASLGTLRSLLKPDNCSQRSSERMRPVGKRGGGDSGTTWATLEGIGARGRWGRGLERLAARSCLLRVARKSPLSQFKRR
uniref:Uncharacterized protein n=1 Tax=Rangifer tarandus platyrhynchus TaxID=3082113 RepID=A0ACB0EV43_RANTA|nr:unnamed protein product [Rangifer tarandus platyrhynchus]